MTATAERTALLASAAAGLLPVAGLGAALLSTECLHLYTAVLALPVLAQGLSAGLR
ncbi:hypothetical protein ACFWXB_16435 [Tsukamurella tyrosinosolvens]|uniref:hypothetical protein n=1 Tax=Tsukamurella tyrosinosolvens TaxID=57704 RepID=UPI00367D3496